MTDILLLINQSGLLSEDAIGKAFLVFTRLGAMMALLPAFGEQTVPLRIRLAITVALTLVVAPAVQDRLIWNADAFASLILIEAAFGLLIGIGLRMFVFVLQIAGAIAAQSTSLSQLFPMAAAEPQSILSNILMMSGLALFTISGLPVQVVAVVVQSYDIPFTSHENGVANLAEWGLLRMKVAFDLGFSLAVPFVIAAFIYNIAIGVINKAMTQLMVSFVGAPALTLGSLALFAIAAPSALALWLSAITDFAANPFMVAK